MRTPQQSRSSTSADRMLDATVELLGSGGLAAVTVAAVAAAAGASNGSLYHRFGDRTGLLLAAQERVLTEIEAETAAAFAAADAEPDDAAALLLLSRAALAIFAEHHGAMRALLGESRGLPAVEARNRANAHLLARTITGWFRSRFAASPAAAEAAYRVIYALGATRTLFDEDQVSPDPLPDDALARSLAAAIAAVVRG